VVRLDGKPLKGAAVRFVPAGAHGTAYIASGVTDEQGRFRLTCNGQPGACTGENRVLVMEDDIPARLRGESEEAQRELAAYFRSLGGRPIPEKYTNLVTSPLVVNVTPEQKVYRLELNRRP
jgi:hypothetical protein